MDWRRQVAGVALAAIATTVAAKNGKPPIAVAAEPIATTFDLGENVGVKLTITNNGEGRISFETCPGELYRVEIKDNQGMPVATRVPEPPVEKDGELIRPADLMNLVDCVSSILVTLKPGESWSTGVSVGQYVDLKLPGFYTGRIIWLTLGEVPSNSFRFTIRAKRKD